MKDSTARTLRTVAQVAVAVLTVVPDVVYHLPLGAAGVQILVVAAAAAKGLNSLEDLGVIPAVGRVPDIKVPPLPAAVKDDDPTKYAA